MSGNKRGFILLEALLAAVITIGTVTLAAALWQFEEHIQAAVRRQIEQAKQQLPAARGCEPCQVKPSATPAVLP